MHIDWWTLGLQTINVVVLIWLLGRFLFRPVAEIVAQRQAAANHLLAEAQQARSEAAAARDAAAAQTRHLADARAEGLKQAAADAEAERRALLEKARDEVERLRAAAQADIARQRALEAGQTAERATRFALEIATKLMLRLPERARIDGFVEGLATALQALPDASRMALGRDEPLRIKAPRQPTETEAQACRDALGAVLARPLRIEFEIDPALIAGLEIDAPHARIRNSLRGDLDRIAAQLMDDRHGAG